MCGVSLRLVIFHEGGGDISIFGVVSIFDESAISSPAKPEPDNISLLVGQLPSSRRKPGLVGG
ncbi:MAG: hypothetical protein QOI53_4470 [Verrucomicrobiota bacterium]|jgi:hypothetical protein|nr:hypothetical protein [Verrucomicrobiota bacterium]